MVTRVTRAEREVIDQAMELDGATPFHWIRKCLLERAKTVIRRHERAS